MGGRSTMRACVLTLVAVLCVLALPLPADSAGATYIPVDLGYPYAFSLGSLTAVNDAGQIVGSAGARYLGMAGMSWTQSAGFSSVPFAERGQVNAVSPGGRIAGNRLNYDAPGPGQVHAFAATSASDPAPIDLGTLGGVESEAYGVNDAGTVVGSSSTSMAGSETHAFVWTRAGGMLDIGTLGGSRSVAYGINASGVVVGYAYTANSGHAFSWTRAGGMVDLGTLGGAGGFSVATAISNTGQVVGDGQTNSFGGPYHAFSWTQGGGMVDLGALPGGTDSFASAVNDNGRIVGNSDTVPFTWTQAEGMSALPQLGTDTRVHGVNASGLIVGEFMDGERQGHGIIWRPVDSQPIAPSPLHLDLFILYGIPVTGLDVSGSRLVRLAGYSEGGVTVTLYRDGVAVGASTIDPESSQWSVADTVPADGIYSYTAKVTAAGRDSALSAAFVVKVVTQGPAITVSGAPSGIYDVSSIPARPTVTASSPFGITSTSDTWVTPTSATGVGDYVYTASATDPLLNQSSAMRIYIVRYGNAYASHSNTSTAFRPGSSIPLRFDLGNGAPITTAGATLWVHAGETPVPVAYDGSAPAANRFHYVPATKQYAFDLRTDRSYVNSDGTRIARFQPGPYTLTIALDDGTTRSVHVRLASASVAIGRVKAVTGMPRAGKSFAVTFAVTRPGTSSAVSGARVTASVRFGTRAIRHAASYRAGKARTSFTVPRGSRGKLLTITMTVRAGGGVATRVASFRIH